MKKSLWSSLALLVVGGTLTACSTTEASDTPPDLALIPAVSSQPEALKYENRCLIELEKSLDEQVHVGTWGEDPQWYSEGNTLVLTGIKDVVMYDPVEFVSFHYLCTITHIDLPEQVVDVQIGWV